MLHINSAKITTPSPRLWIQMRALHHFHRGPSLSPPFSTSRWSHHGWTRLVTIPSPTVPAENKVDAEVGKAHHMRVTWSRQFRSRRFPGPVISTTPQPHPYPWPIPSHVEHGPWLWLGNRWKSWGAKALSPMSESCEANPTSCGRKRELKWFLVRGVEQRSTVDGWECRLGWCILLYIML